MYSKQHTYSHTRTQVDLDEFIQFCTMLHNAEKNGFDTSDNISMAYQKQKDLLEKGKGKKLTGIDLLAQRNRSTSPRARSPRLTKNASMSESGTSPNPGTALMRKQNSMSPRLQRKGSFKAGDQEGTDYVTTSDTLAYANDEWTTRTSNGKYSCLRILCIVLFVCFLFFLPFFFFSMCL